jgi:steroid delta-isomerase-like uncharacterized protein
MQSSETATGKDVAMRFAIEAWGTKSNWQKVWDEVIAPDVIFHHSALPEPIHGSAPAKSFYAGLFEGFPEMAQTIEMVIAENDQVAMLHRLKGIQSGNFLGIPPTGKLVEGNGARFFKIAGGKIVETWYEINLLGAMQQLGVIPNKKM